MRHLLCTTLFLLATPLWAGAANTTAHTEITSLLERLQMSGCQFNRNGTWYTAAEAKAHLLDKLEYVEKKVALKSTEQFIDLAASKSSMSGNPYQVRCGNTAPVESRLWLTEELKAMRSGTHDNTSGKK